MTDRGSGTLVVDTLSGPVRGYTVGGLSIFRGIPFAAPPVGDLRFRATQPVPPWTEVLDATSDGAISYQDRPSKLSAISGPVGSGPMSEDCLTLNICTPGADGEKRPVLVWLHGGAFLAGAGSVPGYRGAALARNGDIVVVSVNYRLGVLGFLYAPELSPDTPANFGILDQAEALRWVRDNIAAFGGDPGQVTLAGQSAGAMSCALHLGRPESARLFQQVILQSCLFGHPVWSPTEADETRWAVCRALDVSPAGLRDVSAQRLLSATRPVQAQLEPGLRAMFARFAPVRDDVTVHSDYLGAATSATADMPAIIGVNRDEANAFLALSPRFQDLSADQAVSLSAGLAGDQAERLIAELRRRRPQADGSGAVMDLVSALVIQNGSVDCARQRARLGAPTYAYEFAWQSPAFGGKLGACHCLELPFTFGDLPAWRAAGMLHGAREGAVGPLAAAVSRYWINFVRTGDPNGRELISWPPLDAELEQTIVLDAVISVQSRPLRDISTILVPEPARLVLASASPSRLRLLRDAGVAAQVRVSGVDEDAVQTALGLDATPAQVAVALAAAKADAIVAELPRDSDAEAPQFVLGCDSLLEFEGQILGKPRDAAQAIARWQSMRGRVGVLHTGQSLVEVATGRRVDRVADAVVRFGTPADSELADYVRTGEPLRVAGGFTLEGYGSAFVDSIDGSYGTVTGLSIPLLRQMFAQLGVRWTDLWG